MKHTDVTDITAEEARAAVIDLAHRRLGAIGIHNIPAWRGSEFAWVRETSRDFEESRQRHWRTALDVLGEGVGISGERAPISETFYAFCERYAGVADIARQEGWRWTCEEWAGQQGVAIVCSLLREALEAE